MKTVVHVLRHGEVHNPEGILYGRLPGYHLSELGQKMAERVADTLADRDIVHLVTSPLERARQTAAPLAQRLGLEVTTDPNLIESANYFEGKRFGVGDGALRHPRVWWVVRNPFTPSWGERYAVVARRMTTALHAARAAAAGHEAVCVSHQLPIWVLRRRLEGRPLWHHPARRECALASLTSFHFEGEALTQIEYTEPASDLIRLSPGAEDAKGA